MNRFLVHVHGLSLKTYARVLLVNFWIHPGVFNQAQTDVYRNNYTFHIQSRLLTVASEHTKSEFLLTFPSNNRLKMLAEPLIKINDNNHIILIKYTYFYNIKFKSISQINEYV